jgi:tellurite resistance protein TerC
VIYIFGAFLIFTGIKMFLMSKNEPSLENNWLLRFMNKHARITKIYHDDNFIVRINNQLWITPLFLALILIEMFDVVFAIDSVPAVLAISQDPFIVYTSNIFAILGLRSLYFILATQINRLYYLKIGLAFILIFIGCKMVLAHYYSIPTLLTLLITLIIFVSTIIASLIKSYQLSK